jgi:hypothetical protein
VLVDLRWVAPQSGWTAETVLELDAEHREAGHTVRAAAGVTLLLQRRVRYVDLRGQVTTLDWDTAAPTGRSSAVLVVGDPLPEVVDVQVLGSARFGTAVARLVVELAPRSDPGHVDTRVLDAAAPVATWSWAAAEGTDRGYDYRVTVHTMAGEVREGDWRPGTPGKLVVGEGFTALRPVTLYLVGGTPGAPLAARGLLAVKVRFSYADAETGLAAEHEVLVTDPSQPLGWTYPVAAPDRTGFWVQLTGVGTDGRLWPQPPLASTDLIVIAALPDLTGVPAPTPVSDPAPAQG